MGRRARVDCRARDLLFAGRTRAADNDPAPAAAVGRQPGRRGIAYGGPHRQGNRCDLRLADAPMKTNLANILMPQLGETVSEGTIVAWLKSEGDTVLADEIQLEIETDKAATEVPAPIAGVLTRILVPAGQTVVVGTALAVIEAIPAAVTTATAAGSVLAEMPTTPSWRPESAPAAAPRGRLNGEPKVDRAGQ